MTNLIKQCKKFFSKTNLYSIFDIDKNSSEKSVKRAYHRLSLKYHPDRVPEEEKDIATEKFKVISAIHSVLSNKSKRELYDKTGSVDTEDFTDIEEWKQYWKCIFKEVTEQDIINYEAKYKGSEEEMEDLKQAYINHGGDMNKILEFVLFSHPDDESRFGEILRKWIDDGEVPAFDKYLKEPASRKQNRKKKFEKEAALAERESKNRKVAEANNSMTDLVNAIQSRQNSAPNFLDKLEEKYSKAKPNKDATKRRKR